MLKPDNFFELSEFQHKVLFDDTAFVWEALTKLKSYIKSLITPNIASLRKDGVMLSRTCVFFKGEVIDRGFEIEHGDATKEGLKVFMAGRELKGASVFYAGSVFFDDNISIGEGTVVEPGALIKGPVIIGRNTEVRQGAYIRGNCLVGDRCVVGHTTEMKNAVMLNDAKAGHFAYIGDSILGNNVNLGAGTKLANLKISGSEVKLKIEGRLYSTGLRKFGAVLGDDVETGCNTVTSPGALLGKRCLVYPNTSVPGKYYPPLQVIRGAVSVKSYKHK
ncbi:MAG: glucose-1-phosphate thymidylyltransferase [Nitrospirae bacterium]|nr:glucose-1-phosphate thymidylyltransferase [Nitrospirota bacterium]